MDSLLTLLEKCSLFKNKSLEEIEFLMAKINYEIKSFTEGENVFSPLQTADKIGIVLSGTVDVQKFFPSGKIIILERKKSPDLIAESTIFSMYPYYPENIAVHKSSKILFIRKTELRNLFALDADFMMNYLESVSNSVLLLKHKIGILSLDSIQEKIAAYLAHNDEPNKHINKDSNKDDSNIINLPFSKKAWAEYMDVSRTSLSRELKKLETAGIISVHKREIEIKDWERLENILSL